MTLYFFNSYQQSPTGFQLSQLEAGDSQLELTDMQNIRSEEFRSLMNSSGAFCTIGFVKNTHYLVFRNISVIDADSRKWYITLGVTSEKSEEQFVRLLQKLFLDYSGFLTAVRDWFYVTPEQPLSYAVHADVLNAWLRGPVPQISKNPFYLSSHSSVQQFRMMMRKIEEGIHRRIFLLVPESTVGYFYNQNTIFAKELPQFLFNSDEFFKLLLADKTLLNTKEQYTPSSSVPLWEQLGITKDKFIQYIITGIIACTSFIGVAGHWILTRCKELSSYKSSSKSSTGGTIE